VIFTLTLYMQKILGYTAIQTGLAFLPLAFMILIFSNVASRQVVRVGVKRMLILGLTITVVGLLLFLGLSANGSYVQTLLPGLLVVGLGMGPTFGSMVIAATTGVSDDEQGLASGVFNTTQQVGSGLVLAAVTAISTAQATSLLQNSEPMKAALAGGFRYALITCAILDALAVVVAIFVIPTSKSLPKIVQDEGRVGQQVTGQRAR
jgi:MFS family permease